MASLRFVSEQEAAVHRLPSIHPRVCLRSSSLPYFECNNLTLQWQRLAAFPKERFEKGLLAALPRERDGMVSPLSKIVFIHNRPVKLYSLEGRSWFSRAKDFKGFKKRVRREFVGCRRHFHTVGARPDPG